MKRIDWKQAAYWLAAVALILLVLDRMSFARVIRQEIPVGVYRDGVRAEESVITMDGKRTNHLFRRKDSFQGRFEIPQAEITQAEKAVATIYWGNAGADEPNVQCIKYNLYRGQPVGYYMITDKTLTEFALVLSDGTVLATSEEAYGLFTEYFSWQSNEDGSELLMGIDGVVPQIS